MDAHKNLAISTVATAPSPALSGTSLVVAAGTGAIFPATPFNAVVCPAGAQPTLTNAEILRVTTIATDTFTIVRSTATEPSAIGPRSIVVGDQIFAALTAKSLLDIEALVAPVVQTTTSTGTQNNFALTANASVLRCNNASALTITGIAAAADGTQLLLMPVNAAVVLTNNDSGSSAGNKIVTGTGAAIQVSAAGLLLVYDGTTAVWRVVNAAAAAGTISVPTSGTQNSSGTETTLWSKSVPAGLLAANGDALYFAIYGRDAANGNTKTIKVKFGATSLTVRSAADNGSTWNCKGFIVRLGATSQQMTAAYNYDSSGDKPTNGSPAETLANAITFSVTGQGTSTGDITVDWGELRYVPFAA